MRAAAADPVGTFAGILTWLPAGIAASSDDLQAVVQAWPWVVIGVGAGMVRVATLHQSLKPGTRPEWGRAIGVLVGAPFIALIAGAVATHYAVPVPLRLAIVAVSAYMCEHALRTITGLGALIEAKSGTWLERWIDRKTTKGGGGDDQT